MSTNAKETILAAARKTAQAHGYGGLSYRDLAAEVERRARGLLRAGVGLGDPVILCGPGGADWIMACLAVLHCGACVVPVDATLGAESFRHVLRDSGARIALVAQSSALRLHRPLEQQGARVLPMAQDDAPDDSREAVCRLTSLVTVLSMNYLYTNRFFEE